MTSVVAQARALKRALNFILHNLRYPQEPLNRDKANLWARLRGLLEMARAPRPSISFLARPKTWRVGGDGLTLLSANLWHDWPLHRDLPARLEAFAQLVEKTGPQVVMLQEVARTPELHVDSWLARRLGMEALYFAANGNAQSIGFEEGVALLSRFPLQAPLGRVLDDQGGLTRRVALAARVVSPWGPIYAVSTHLSLRRRRRQRQFEDLQGWVLRLARGATAVIGGDFNTGEGSSLIQRARQRWLDAFRAVHPTKAGRTHRLILPFGLPVIERRLDYIFLANAERHWRVLASEHLQAPGRAHSDHHAVLARLAPR